MSEQNSTIPKHIAIIPDGNRRWAKQRLLAPWKGHEEGVNRIQEIAEKVFESGIPFCTIWLTSGDNLTKRPVAEVKVLLWLMEKAVTEDSSSVESWCIKNQIRVRVFGRWQEIIQNQIICEGILRLQEITAGFSEKNLTLLLAYDGQSEMVAALNHLALTKQIVDATTLRTALWTADLPPVDLVVRTGGEPHWSAGFMMWHVANSQLYFTDCLWPDFTSVELTKALEDFAGRQRRFGK